MNDQRPVDRRTLISRGSAAGALGLVTAALPGVASAASGAGATSESVPTPEDPVIAAWSLMNAAQRFTSASSTVAAPGTYAWVTAGSTITGTMGLGGNFYSSYASLVAAPKGLNPDSDNRTWFYAKNPVGSIDVSDTAAPYWYWSITAGLDPIDFGFMYMGFNSSPQTVMSLRTSDDNYVTSIRDFAGNNDGYASVKIDLSSLSVLAAGATRTFRLYVRTDSSEQFILFSGGTNPGLTASDSWNTALGGANFGFIHA